MTSRTLFDLANKESIEKGSTMIIGGAGHGTEVPVKIVDGLGLTSSLVTLPEQVGISFVAEHEVFSIRVFRNLEGGTTEQGRKYLGVQGLKLPPETIENGVIEIAKALEKAE